MHKAESTYISMHKLKVERYSCSAAPESSPLHLAQQQQLPSLLLCPSHSEGDTQCLGSRQVHAKSNLLSAASLLPSCP
eukprot:1161280-Pelagomonas_calceolata.AAC.4